MLNECRALKNEKIEDSIKLQKMGNQIIYLMKENANKLTTIKSLKRDKINLYGEYKNLKIAYNFGAKSNKLDKIDNKYIIQNIQEASRIQNMCA